MVTIPFYGCAILVIFLGISTVGQGEYVGLDYLMKYGYMDSSDQISGSLKSKEFIKQAIMKFQRMAGIDVTGVVNDETRTWMNKPRCGVSDNMGNSDAARKKRYALHGSKWDHNDISYRISRPTNQLDRYTTETELQRAFNVWTKHTPLTFTPKDYGTVDIDIQFAGGSHGDNKSFDGPGKTLAHAFFPRFGGDVHFDDDERFTRESHDGINLFQVAAHEFGHSLGLSHSDVQTSLMAPFYQGYQPSFKLDGDDIAAIQELYGRRTAPDVTTKTPMMKPTRGLVSNIPNVCRGSVIDAVTRTEDGTTYMFTGDIYVRLNAYGVDAGYPKKISEDWQGVSGPVDAALTWKNGFTYLFQGEHYWTFQNQRYVYGPKSISNGFPGVPNNIDAAFVWSGNGKTYFIKGDEYWRYSRNAVHPQYPKPLSVWKGIPDRIEAVFQWKNGRTYFFSGEKYYRFNDKEFNIDSSYPRYIGEWWLSCPTKEQIIRFDRNQAAGVDDQHMMGIVKSEADSNSDQWLDTDDPSGSMRLRISFLLVVICLSLSRCL